MKVNTLKYSQIIPISLDRAWNFLSSPKNLKLITPKSMNFNITDWDNRDSYPGQIIQYTVEPIFGIKLKWVTEITHLEKNKYFVDEQRFGPYSFWHHKHFLKEVEGGVLMEDIIHYKLPYGFFGELINIFFVRKKLKEIFSYRKNELIKIFQNT